jgi:catechol 2,3-dioxygenase-like lactoylglutathione lyase family enzyme
MTPQRISIISVPVSDQQAARRFYTEVLGFAVVRDNPFRPDARWIELSPRGGEAAITLVTWFPQMPAGCLQGMLLTTDDLAADHALLRGRGLAITDIERAPWGAYATFSDPDGNGWVLQQNASVG